MFHFFKYGFLLTNLNYLIVKGDNDDIFFIKLLLLVLQPILYIFIATMIWTLVYRIKKRKIINNKQFKKSILMTSIVIIYVLQPGILKSTLQLFKYLTHLFFL